MKVFVVVEDFDSGPGIASLNICNIFLSEKKANEMKESLIKDARSFYSEEELNIPFFYQDMYRVVDWEVEE
jgi:hypothetical protein